MFKPLIPIAILGLASCVGPLKTLPFSKVVSGDVPKSSDFSLDGIFDKTGINFYSLVESTDRIGSEQCIPLIMTPSDQERSKLLDGKRVKIEGRAIYLSDLYRVIPTQTGEINGRTWSGTRCASEVAIFVSRMETAQ